AVREALYGLGPVVVGLFAVAVYRLGRTAAGTVTEAAIAVVAVALSFATPLGGVAILLLGGAAGLALFHGVTRRGRAIALAVAIALVVLGAWWGLRASTLGGSGGAVPDRGRLTDVAAYFLEVGAFTIGGGLTMIAFIQEGVVGRFGWLTPREFNDGLALGQLTPGPVLMIAAYV